jgi:cytidylate kinase
MRKIENYRIDLPIRLRSPVGAIVDGRDIGTVVFPDADLKANNRNF